MNAHGIRSAVLVISLACVSYVAGMTWGTILGAGACFLAGLLFGVCLMEPFRWDDARA